MIIINQETHISLIGIPEVDTLRVNNLTRVSTMGTKHDDKGTRV